jgi:uncharacterized protein YjiS (DUF1127 family)
MHTRARGLEQGRIGAPPGALADRLVGMVRWLLHEIVRRREVLRQRRGLLELDDHLLRDIGLRREDALREADRLLWQDALGLRLDRLPLRPDRKGRRS